MNNIPQWVHNYFDGNYNPLTDMEAIDDMMKDDEDTP